MVSGVGVDIEKISNFRENATDAFLERFFTPHELEYCRGQPDEWASLCGRFCAKEAVVKAVGRIDIGDVEVLTGGAGVEITVNGERQESVRASISHSGDYAIAFAVRE